MPGIELKRIEEIAYREVLPEGQPSGAPVILIHGYPESSLMWRDLLPPLASAGRRAVAPDLPGYGYSPPFRPALDVPTLILWGEHDEFAPVENAHRFKREIPHAELVLIEGANHFAFEDDPDRCAQEIVGFLDRAEI